MVNVVIELDANSPLVGTPSIRSSPNKLLDEFAIGAAEQSTFRTAIRNCKPVAATYIFAVDFNNNKGKQLWTSQILGEAHGRETHGINRPA